MWFLTTLKESLSKWLKELSILLKFDFLYSTSLKGLSLMI